jgi:hypothetical protein
VHRFSTRSSWPGRPRETRLLQAIIDSPWRSGCAGLRADPHSVPRRRRPLRERRGSTARNRVGCKAQGVDDGIGGGIAKAVQGALSGIHLHPARAQKRGKRTFSSFLPAISKPAMKRISAEVRSWRLHLRTGHEFADLARRINPIVRSWMQYYGAFYGRRYPVSCPASMPIWCGGSGRSTSGCRRRGRLSRACRGSSHGSLACSRTGPGCPRCLRSGDQMTRAR